VKSEFAESLVEEHFVIAIHKDAVHVREELVCDKLLPHEGDAAAM
jgi:hypothetical protein